MSMINRDMLQGKPFWRCAASQAAVRVLLHLCGNGCHILCHSMRYNKAKGLLHESSK